MIVYEENLDYCKHLEFALGEHLQALDELNRTNANVPQAFDYLFLDSNNAKQGRHELLYLPENNIVVWRKIWSALVMKNAIAQVEAITKRKGMPKGLKIKNKWSKTLHNAS